MVVSIDSQTAFNQGLYRIIRKSHTQLIQSLQNLFNIMYSKSFKIVFCHRTNSRDFSNGDLRKIFYYFLLVVRKNKLVIGFFLLRCHFTKLAISSNSATDCQSCCCKHLLPNSSHKLTSLLIRFVFYIVRNINVNFIKS